MSSEIALQIENLSKCYQIYDKPYDRLKQSIYPSLQLLTGIQPKQYFREFWALKNISFEVKKGESVGIVGRNGSGKSTLLQLITGTLSPSSGAVKSKGRIAALLELGAGFNPEFSGRENVYLNGALLGFNRQQIDEKFDAIAAFADIGEYLEQPVKTYSSGMLVRLAFAVQVQVEPDILIVDEALAVGDWLYQKRCLQRIQKLVADGMTLLFVSHDQESVRTLTSRSLLLNRGSAKAWGVSSEVVLEYRKLLHEEEEEYFRATVNSMSERNLGTDAYISRVDFDESPVKRHESEENTSNIDCCSRSDQLSFGDGAVKVLAVQTLNANDEACSVFYPGEKLKIRLTCQSSISSDKLNVGVRIRNKEGIKIYSWGTLNQDMFYRHSHLDASLFWNKVFKTGEKFVVIFSCDCPLGVNLYEIQASVSYEETPDYLSQRILHWVDEAAFFQVAMKHEEYFFGGVVDMRMKAIW
jgi:lipopolysaccharide transport system ATP-binding protein